jgi:hypothetical protein
MLFDFEQLSLSVSFSDGLAFALSLGGVLAALTPTYSPQQES